MTVVIETACETRNDDREGPVRHRPAARKGLAMSDHFTEVTSRSWFSRIGGAFSGILFGFLLLLAAIAGLFWNEGRAVNTARALSEGAGSVVTVDPARPAAASGQLVHFSGPLTIQGAPVDPLFPGLGVPDNANRLKRMVEMYQWQESSRSETRKKLGGGEETVTTYSYAPGWVSRPVDSAAFKQPAGHANPPMPVESNSFAARAGTVGQITIPGNRLAGLGNDTALALGEGDLDTIASALNDGRAVRLSGGMAYVGASPANPRIGDLRISFETSAAGTVSAVGTIDNGTLGTFTASNGVAIGMIEAGEKPASAMFEAAQASNTALTWGLRIAGLIAMLIGFRMIFSIVGVLGDVVPFIGDVFRFATGLAAMALTAVIGTLTIGLAWVWYRPLLGWSIIAIGAALAIAFIMLGKRRARAAVEGAAAAS